MIKWNDNGSYTHYDYIGSTSIDRVYVRVGSKYKSLEKDLSNFFKEKVKIYIQKLDLSNPLEYDRSEKSLHYDGINLHIHFSDGRFLALGNSEWAWLKLRITEKFDS